MAKLVDIMIMLGRFLATAFGMAMNMKRITSTEASSLDDLMFVLSIIVGFMVGIYWNNVVKYFNNK